MQKDWKRLVQFEQSSNRSYDETFLANTKDERYCYLFDSACIPKGMIRRSVLDILSNMRTPAIMVVVSPSQLEGRLYFYDGARISEGALRRSLQSRKFRCEQVPNQMAFWDFELVNDRWLARTLFDYATDALCPPLN